MGRGIEIGLAILLTVGLEAAVLASHAAFVDAPGDEAVANGLLAAGGVTAIALLIGLATQRAIWLWLGMLALPLGVTAVSRWPFDSTMPLTQVLGAGALVLFVEIGRGVVDFLWVGGPRRVGWRRLAWYVPVLALWGQSIALGAQIVLPGAVVFGLTALLPIVAARRPEGWLQTAFTDIGRATMAWLLACFGLALAVPGVDFAVSSLLLGPEVVLAGWFSGFGVSTLAGAIGETAGQLAGGLVLALAARLYDEAQEVTVAEATGHPTGERDNPYQP